MTGPSEAIPPVLEITPLELHRRLESGHVVTLLDVREPQERACCAIIVPPNSTDLFIPMRQIPARLQEIASSAQRGLMVVYCHHGVRSEAVANWLAERGIGAIANLTGGIDAWSVEVDSSVPRYR